MSKNATMRTYTNTPATNINDRQEAIEVMNGSYHYLKLYINFFQPTFKLLQEYRKTNR